MKTTISKLKYVLFLFVIIGFVSCEGPIGPDGLDGIDGVDGADGTDGTDGNANVISSAWITATWSATNSTFGGFDYITEDITQDIMSTGVVLSYCDWYGDALSVYTVPFTYGSTNIVSFAFGLEPGEITWFFYAQSNYIPPSDMRLRYVIIPSSASKSTNSKQAIYDELEEAGVDINNYYEVMDYYGLEY